MSTSDITDTLAGARGQLGRITGMLSKRLILGFAGFMVIYLSITPTMFLIWTSFWSGRPGSLDGAFTLDNYIAMYSNPEIYYLFLNTMVITFGMFAIAMTLGTIFAWLIGRTTLPTKEYMELVILAPYAIPSVIYAIMFVFAFSPEAGLVNSYWTYLTGSEAPLFNIYSTAGIFIVMGIDAVTLVYLIVVPSLTSMDPNLEESSRIHGANMTQTIARISLPITLPALASAGIIVLIRGIGTFASVAIIGVRFGFDVFATRIWEVTTQSFPPNWGYATALAMTLLFLTGVLIVIYRYITRRKEDYMVITGEGYRAADWDLGKWTWPIVGGVWFLLFAIWIIPIAIMFIASFHTLWQGAIIPADFSLEHYVYIFNDARFWNGMTNTVWIAAGATIAGTALVTLAAYYTERTEYPFRGVVDFFLLTPMAVPGIILGSGVLLVYLYVYNIFGVNILGTIALIVIGVVTKDLPTTSRIASGNIVQIHTDLEEIARVSGASWADQMKDIFVPLYKGTLGVLVFYWFIGAIKQLTVPLMLYSSSTEPVSVLIFRLWSVGSHFEQVAVISAVFMVLMLVLLVVLKLFNIRFYEIIK